MLTINQTQKTKEAVARAGAGGTQQDTQPVCGSECYLD